MLQEVFVENTFEQRLEGREQASLSIWKSVPSRGNSKCGGPEVPVSLGHWRKAKAASVVRAQRARGGNKGGLSGVHLNLAVAP